MHFSLICLPVGISVYMSAFHCVWLSGCVPVCLCTFPPVHMSTCLYVSVLSTWLPAYLSSCLHVCFLPSLPMYLSACLYVCLNTNLGLHVSPEYISVSAHCQRTCLPVNMSTCLNVCRSTTLYIYKSPMDCLLFRRKPSIAVSHFEMPFSHKKCDCSNQTLRYVLYIYLYVFIDRHKTA